MEFGLRELLTILGFFGTAIVTFLTTRHNLKEYIRDKTDELKDKIHQQELELEKLKAKDENQQQVINQLDKLVFELIPSLTKNINVKSRGKND